MSAGRKLGYAAAIAVGLLAATALAVSAQNLCVADVGTYGLRFTNCTSLDAPIATQSAAQLACDHLYTQGYYSRSGRAADAHEQAEADLIRNGLTSSGWTTSGVVGSTDWKFEADTETIDTKWGYEDPATIGQSIADLTTLIDHLGIAITAGASDPTMVTARTEAEEERDILNDIQVNPGTVHVPYYADLPDWVDNAGANPPLFDPGGPGRPYLWNQPRAISAEVGYFVGAPPWWDPTAKPALEIIKCEGWSVTSLRGSVTQFDSGGVYCPSVSGWTTGSSNASSGTCNYSRRTRDWHWTPPPPCAPCYGPYYTEYTTRNWGCRTRAKSITIGGHTESRSLSGSRARDGSTWSCRYVYPLPNNFSSHLGGFGVNLTLSSKPTTTVGTDITTDTSSQSTVPEGWAVHWVEAEAPSWPPGPCGVKPCWGTFAPVVGMSPRLDQLPVGTPVWVWVDNVPASCLPNLPTRPVDPPPSAPECDDGRALLWETWPTDEADPNTWRLTELSTQAGNIHRAAFPQKISIALTHTVTGATSTYECWTDDEDEHGVPRPVADGEWAPGRRPFKTLTVGGVSVPGPLATPSGPLTPGVGDCAFVHTTAGEHTAIITIHWIGKVGYSSPISSLAWTDPNPALGDNPPLDTVQGPVTVVFHELHVTPGS